jgi:hypothetical protein
MHRCTLHAKLDGNIALPGTKTKIYKSHIILYFIMYIFAMRPLQIEMHSQCFSFWFLQMKRMIINPHLQVTHQDQFEARL